MPLIPNRSLKYNDHGKTSMLTGRTTLGGPTLEQNSHPEQGSWAQSCGAHLTSSLPSSTSYPGDSSLLQPVEDLFFFCATFRHLGTNSTGLPRISTDQGEDKRVPGHYG